MTTDYAPAVALEATLIENERHECPVLKVQEDGERMTCMRPASYAALFSSECCGRDAWVYLCEDCAGLTHLWCAVHTNDRIPRAAFLAL